jgi:pimeloyl-ACP methyl ester carboxylesterase
MTEKFPLLLVPGLLCSAALWRPQIEALGDVASPFIADTTADDSFAGMAKRALAIMPDRFALAGLSMGGYVAQEIMRQAPERVTRLALLDTSARSDSPEQHARRMGLIELSEKGQFKGVTPRLLPLLIHHARLEDEVLTGVVMDMAETIGKAAFLRQQKAIMGRPDGRGDLARISCPTLVLCGRQDALTPVALHEEIADLIPGSRLAVIEDCGHLSTLEKPRSVSAAMRQWLGV